MFATPNLSFTLSTTCLSRLQLSAQLLNQSFSDLNLWHPLCRNLHFQVLHLFGFR